MRSSFSFFSVLLVLLSVNAGIAEPTIQDEMSVLSKRVQNVENSVKNTASKQALISMQNKMKILERELQNLRNENEGLRNELNQLKNKQRENFLAIDQRLQAKDQNVVEQNVTITDGSAEVIDAGSATVVASEVQPEATSTVQVTTVTEDSSETTDAYRDAFLLLKQRRYDESITAFENFLQSYPNSKYAANAQYWLAEANYVTKR
ncbi:MAG: YbgF trimerization domain-containing protein, partial [Pseudomonadota bacterium]